MNLTRRFVVLGLMLSMSLTVVAGCGSGERRTYKISGTVLRGEQPLTFDKTQNQLLQVMYCELGADGQVVNTFIGEVQPSGAYTVDVPSGKFRVAVAFYDPYPMNDKLRGNFGLQSSLLVEEIKGARTIPIDVTVPAGGS